MASIEAFATEVAIAITLAAARADRARLNVLGDRERIAGDLHDRVIQRLSATGMGLQATAVRVGDDQIGERIDSAVRELNETITELRPAIFRLSEPTHAQPYSHGIRTATERHGPGSASRPPPTSAATSTAHLPPRSSSSFPHWTRRSSASPCRRLPCHSQRDR